MSEEATEAFDVLNMAMISYFCAFDSSFEDIQGNALDRGIQLNGQVDLVLTDPPKRTVKQTNKDDNVDDDQKEFDAISLTEMDDFVKLCSDILKPGGHGVIFCSSLQFHLWFFKLLSAEEEVPDFESDTTGTIKKMEKIFQVESQPLTFVSQPARVVSKKHSSLHHHSVTEQAIHFWRKGLSTTASKRV